MKKVILIIVLVSFIAGYIRAQEISTIQVQKTDYRDKFMFGLKIGGNYSNIYDENSDSFEADGKFGLATGMFLALPIGKLLGVQPEVLFSQKGFKAKGILRNSYELKRTTNYIDVPIMFALKPSGFFTLLAGPEFSYLLKRSDVYTSGSSSIQNETEFKNDNLRRNIFGFIIGADIHVGHLLIGGRYGWDIQKNNGDGTSTIPRYKNVWTQITLGYRFYN